MRKWIITAGLIALASATPPALADYYFRGTPNNWGTTALTQVDSTTYTTCQAFGAGDASGGPRFKVDRYGNWSESYPASDYTVTANTSYQIRFNASTRAITAEAVSSCNSGNVGFAHSFNQLYFRGTANGWSTTAMTLVADHTWQLIINFDGQSNQRFKLDVNGNWSLNYGDNNSDGVLDKTGSDIYPQVSGNYLLTVNDQTLAYRLEADSSCSNCTSQSPAVTTLGAVYSTKGTTFSLWSPDSSNVKVMVDGSPYVMKKVADFNGYTNVYQVFVPGDLHLATYTFFVNEVPVRDPYGKMAEAGTGDDGAVNIVMDMSRTEPEEGWASRPPLRNREDAIIYEAHVRDFSIDPSSGVSDSKRGKFLGMVESNTSYNGASTGLDHLKELGVTHVQLLPVYDFATCDGLPDSDPCYNWGYDPRNYNVPEDRYSQTPTDYEARVREFKTMVNEYHKAGIRVVMDVVYNHTFNKQMFSPISGKYYTTRDLSGTGNSIDADQAMVSRMIRDSLEYWVKEYGVDGFRFDLIGVFSYAEVEKWGGYLNSTFPDRNLLLYGEPWNGYAYDEKEAQRVRYGTTRLLSEEHVGVFNGAYREAIKGNNDGTGTGYMFNNLSPSDNGWAIYDGFLGSPYNSNDSRNGTWFRNYTADPEQSVNYISAHDNFGLWDKVYLSLASNVTQDSSHQILTLTPPANPGYAKRVVNFGMGMILTSQGIPFIHSGDEFLRTKTNNEQMTNPTAWNYGQYGGTHNSYNAPDSFNSIKWHNKKDNAATFNYFKSLIALRKSHAGLRMTSNQAISQNMTVARPAAYGGQLLSGYIDSPTDSQRLFIVYNSGNNQNITLPVGSWTRIADANGASSVSGLSGTALVEGTAVTVFTQNR